MSYLVIKITLRPLKVRMTGDSCVHPDIIRGLFLPG